MTLYNIPSYISEAVEVQDNVSDVWNLESETDAGSQQQTDNVILLAFCYARSIAYTWACVVFAG